MRSLTEEPLPRDIAALGSDDALRIFLPMVSAREVGSDRRNSTPEPRKLWGLSNFHLRLSDWPSLATRASRGRDEGWRRPVRRLRSPPSLRRGWVTPGACGSGEGGEQPGGRRAPCQAHRSHADELDPGNRRPSSRVTRPSVETTERRRQRQEQTEDRRQGRSRTLRNPFEDVNLQKVSSSILD